MPDSLTTTFADSRLVPWSGLARRSVVTDDSNLPNTEAIDISAIIAADRLASAS